MGSREFPILWVTGTKDPLYGPGPASVRTAHHPSPPLLRLTATAASLLAGLTPCDCCTWQHVAQLPYLLQLHHSRFTFVAPSLAAVNTWCEQPCSSGMRQWRCDCRSLLVPLCRSMSRTSALGALATRSPGSNGLTTTASM